MRSPLSSPSLAIVEVAASLVGVGGVLWLLLSCCFIRKDAFYLMLWLNTYSFYSMIVIGDCLLYYLLIRVGSSSLRWFFWYIFSAEQHAPVYMARCLWLVSIMFHDIRKVLRPAYNLNCKKNLNYILFEIYWYRF